MSGSGVAKRSLIWHGCALISLILPAHEKPPVLPGVATTPHERTRRVKIAVEGFEPPTPNIGKTGFPQEGGAESGAPHASDPQFPSDLVTVIESWPRLPPPIKAGILAMVSAAQTNG